MGVAIPLAMMGASVIGGVAQGIGQNAANQANAKQAQANRDFQEYMSNTAYTRAVADMKNAGLNPALAYSQGGASTPSGSTATMQNTMGEAGHSAKSAADAFLQGKAVQAQVAKTQQDAQLTHDQDLQLKLESADRALQIKADAAYANTNATLASKTLQPNIEGAVAASRTAQSQARSAEAQATFDQATMTGPDSLRAIQMRRQIDATTASARAANATAVLAELGAPEARANYDFFSSKMGHAMPFVDNTINTANNVAGVVNKLRGGPSVNINKQNTHHVHYNEHDSGY